MARAPRESSPAATEYQTLPGISRAARKCAVEKLPDRLPGSAVELHQSHFLDGAEIGRACGDRNPRQRDRASKIFQRLRLLHDVFAGEIIAALLQDLNQ